MPTKDDERLDPEPFLNQSDDRVVRDLNCSICGDEIDTGEESTTMLLTKDREPICEADADQADEALLLKKAHGSPWNGIHPETGECQAIGYGEWYGVKQARSLGAEAD